jgi:hypothetical protein
MVNHDPPRPKRDFFIQGVVNVGNGNESGLPQRAALKAEKVLIYQARRSKKRERELFIGKQSKKSGYCAVFVH